MADPVPPFRIVIPSVQILALTLAVLWFVIGLDYAEDSMFNNLFVPVLGFLLWGGAQSWIVVGMMKQHYTISREHYRAILWTIPALYTGVVAAVYQLNQPVDPLIILTVIYVAIAYTALLVLWYGVAYLLSCRYCKKYPWKL